LAWRIVFDPSNYVQNTLTAIRTLEQINNQIRQLQNEAQMLMNQARNLASLPSSVVGQLRANLATTERLLYVGAFAYILNNFNWLASIVFRSFAGLGITATGSAITMENFLQPGRLAKTGIDAGAPILEQIGEMAGFPEVFANLDPIVVMFLAWLVVVLCFFVLAIQAPARRAAGCSRSVRPSRAVRRIAAAGRDEPLRRRGLRPSG